MIDVAISTGFAKAGVAVTVGVIDASVMIAEAGQALGEALDQAISWRMSQLAGGSVEDISQIAATRQAYRMLGKDPSRYRPASESLLRRLVQGKGLYRINNIVDVANLVSMRTGFAIGAYDLSRIDAPVIFRIGKGDEGYKAIGRGRLNLENLPVMVDRTGPFGSPTSDSERTMVTAATRKLLLVILGFGDAPDMTAALEHAVERLRIFCHAKDIHTNIATNRPLS